MYIQLLTITIRKLLKGNIVFLLLLSGYVCISAEDKDQEILNQLYNEIVGNGTVRNLDSTGKPELTSPSTLQKNLPNTITGDPVTEQLRKEIEKIAKETQLRHIDAVKFMQDAK
jgi:hypothetical protein